jgi:hypothetical protein
MSKRRTHKVKVRKYNRVTGWGKKMWWMDCSCGWFNGFFDKQEAIDCGASHLEKVAEQAPN